MSTNYTIHPTLYRMKQTNRMCLLLAYVYVSSTNNMFTNIG